MTYEGSRRAGTGRSPNGGDAERVEKSAPQSDDGHFKSRVLKRSLVVGGHKTSVSLEEVFWRELRAIAHDRHVHLSQLVGGIDAERKYCNLSSAIRLFVFEQCRDHSKDPEPEVATKDDVENTQ